MKEIFKINSIQVFLLWRNMAISMLAVCLVLLLSTYLPPFLSPVISTVCALGLYTLVYSSGSFKSGTCMLVPYTIFISLIVYTFTVVIINLLNVWSTSVDLFDELIFFYDPYLPILFLAPLCFVTAIVILLRGFNVAICLDCRINHGEYNTRGRFGIIMHQESPAQLKKIIVIFGVISVVSWVYYLYQFNPTNITSRDTFIFAWLPLFVIVAYVIALSFRYYNLYMELKERNEIVTPGELSEIAVKTYLRFYVICGDSVYINPNAPDELDDSDDEGIIETPFMLNRRVTSVNDSEAGEIIRRLTGVPGGKLRFFFARKSQDNQKHRVYRYFYFIPGKPEDYPTLNGVKGRWYSSKEFKSLFAKSNLRLSPLLNIDMTRLATILVTSKIYDKNGQRKIRMKQYRPSFGFAELHDSDIDFQDNVWIRVACFNSDMANFRLRRWLRGVVRSRQITDI